MTIPEELLNHASKAKTLTQQLLDLQNEFAQKAPEAVQQTMAEATKRLQDSGILDTVKKVGDSAPDFTLLNPVGTPVHLAERLFSHNVVLAFYRGAW